ncbi:proline dehydrogenase family protein [Amycolatopsis thermoflava]|uniref:proline dehydrogenase n=1 Tax=Amycolatopsis thermoflava TaxID=84480 RepID=A0A3N2GP94_9PSEU|nr:proline dehydrogenase family protein [Amycolatopsis thermoflava]ROS38049.1 L-proline dehydrogenase [Amycolatopsis thermoflava]
MLRTALLAAAGSPACRSLVERTPLTRPVVRRFVAGSTVDDALAVTAGLIGSGRAVTLDHLGEDTTDPSMAAATVKAYAELLTLLAEHGLAADAEVSVKLSAVGLRLPDGDRVALDNARRICAGAAAAGTTVTLDMEDHTTTDATLGVLRELRVDFPWVGAVLQAYLRRTEQDCRDLAYAGSRVRLCKGAYAEPASVAFQDKSEVDRSYVRCLRVLMDGAGHPMVATHDPRMIAIAAELGKDRPDWEFQMLYGVRDAEQRRLARDHAVRVYLPYGDEWYGYFVRRLAERPANLAFFLRALVTR